MKRNYYCLVAGLQDIAMDSHKLSAGQIEFRQELINELHPDDLKTIELLFLPNDNQNLINLLQETEKPWDEKGNYTIETLQENIKEPTGELPSYINEFILAYKNDEPFHAQVSWENQLTTLFYDYILNYKNRFLADWFRFERNLNNLLAALVCRKYDIPYEFQIIGTDEISDTIRKSHARDFGLSAEIPYLDDVLNTIKLDKVQEREKDADRLKWEFLDEHSFFEYFTVEKIMTFIIKLGIVERWLTLDKDYGKEMFNKLINELKSSYKLPETFTEK